MSGASKTEITQERAELVERALFHGAGLTLENSTYLHALWTLMGALLAEDLNPSDLTLIALETEARAASAAIVAREPGIAAGVAELIWFFEREGIEVTPEKQDGDPLLAGDVMLRAQGPRTKLLSLERVGLNLTQRMSGIATATHRIQSLASRVSPSTRVVATRKTPWGLLDKRGVHIGGGGTHRLGLGDAILIKNNHLALIAGNEAQAAPIALEKAWKLRRKAAFIEVEVRSEEAAVAAARTFRHLRRSSSSDYPCLLMLDNMTPSEIVAVIATLRRADLWEDVLLEASGTISESNVQDYAASGVDVISIGALTHSPRALDLSQKIS